MPASKDVAYEVTFTLDTKFRGPGTISVVPVTDGRSKATVEIVISPRRDHPQGAPIHVHGFLGFLRPTEGFTDVRALRQNLEGHPDWSIPAKNAPGFFTMLRDMQAYRDIVTQLGHLEAGHVLSSLRDVVEAEDAPGGPSWVKSATDSELFRSAFLRTAEAYFTWKHAASIVQDTEFERVDGISNELRISFQLAARPNPHELKFKFATASGILPRRFAIVIGKNGVGKSQALYRIADSAIRGSGDLTDGRGGRPAFNRILAFYPTAIAGDVFPPERRRRSKVWYRRHSLGGPGFGRRRQTTSDLVVELARSDEAIRKTERFSLFLNAIKAIEGHKELAVRTRDTGERFVLIRELLVGTQEERLERFAAIDPRYDVVRFADRELFPLSSGELTFVRFAALASLHIEDGSLLLFDEPETHLHPNFISQFVLVLDSLLKQTGSAAIIATHSVYFVKEAFQDQVQILRSLEDREIKVEEPIFRTFGADVGAISFFVFGEDETSGLAKRVEENVAHQGEPWEAVFERYKDDLSLDLLGEIRAEIEDRKPQPVGRT